jgi:hypothetical protein
MRGATQPKDPPSGPPGGCRPAPTTLRIAVWPRTEEHEWCAELRMAGATRALRFERPLDLVLFLTALPGTTAKPPGALR